MPSSLAPPPAALQVRSDEPESTNGPGESAVTLVAPFGHEKFARDSEAKMRAAVPVPEPNALAAARRLLREGKPEDALFVLASVAEQGREARAIAYECAATVANQCWAIIGPETTVLRVVVTIEALKQLNLDPVSAFLLSLIDGATDVGTLLDLSGQPELLALRHLRGLVLRGVVVRAIVVAPTRGRLK